MEVTVFFILIIVILLLIKINFSKKEKVNVISNHEVSIKDEGVQMSDEINEAETPINIEVEYDLDKWKNEILNSLKSTYSLSDLIITKDINEIYYVDLLKCFEWKYKRLIILFRDKYSCTDCGKISLNNHVHHLYYLQDKLPWDIDSDGLVTLCSSCHKKRHDNSEIPIYRIESGKFIKIESKIPPCSRCGGIGYIPTFYYHYSGICFKCEGNTIDQGVFSKILKLNYENLNSYSDEKKRNQYIYFINKITKDDFYTSFPEKDRYIKNPEGLYNNDDLPF